MLRFLAVLVLAGCTTAAPGAPTPLAATSPAVTAAATPVPTPPATPAPTPVPTAYEPTVSAACNAAFAAAAAVDVMLDTVEDLDPAVAACTSVAEWRAPAEANPGAIEEGVDPVEFLGNRCSFGEGLRQLGVFREVGDFP